MERKYVTLLEAMNQGSLMAIKEYLKEARIDIESSEVIPIWKEYIQYPDKSKNIAQVKSPVDYFVRDLVRLYPTKNTDLICIMTLTKLCKTLNNVYELLNSEEKIRKESELRIGGRKVIDRDAIIKIRNSEFNEVRKGRSSSGDGGDDSPGMGMGNSNKGLSI